MNAHKIIAISLLLFVTNQKLFSLELDHLEL